MAQIKYPVSAVNVTIVIIIMIMIFKVIILSLSFPDSLTFKTISSFHFFQYFLVFLDLVSVLALPSIINSAWIGLLPPNRLENFS